MTITKDLFTQTIEALRDQYDKDTENVNRLSSIYGADINPNDNRLITNMLFKFLQLQFPPKNEFCEIEIFCFDQDFGRKTGKSASDLWEELVKNIEVDYKEVKG